MTTADSQETAAVELRGVTRRFGAVTALDDVSFSVREGEVTALLGENGAGKSTLLKILAGLQPPSSGEVYVFGKRIEEFTPNSVLSKHSVAIVPQELSLMPDRTVAENILVGIEPGSKLFPSKRQLNLHAQQVLEKLNLSVSPTTMAGSLDMATQQLVVVARAVAQECRVLILDEPTSILTPAESTRLFTLVEDLRAKGTTVLYVSHRMPEVFALSQQIEVLRDGRHVKSARTAEITSEEAVSSMVGRDLQAYERDMDSAPDDSIRPALQLHDLAGRGHEDVSFSVRPGEIVGIAGLPDSGRVELISNVYGSDTGKSGTVTLLGDSYDQRSPARSIGQGMTLLPGERKAQAVMSEMTVGENIGLLRAKDFSVLGFQQKRKWMREAQELATEWGVKTSSIDAPISSLSGGNQQKALLARCLSVKPQVLILDEPTRGVDVGAKADIYERISAVAKQGVAVLCSSSDLPELLAIADRIIVMSEGRVAGTLTHDEASEEQIMTIATGSSIQEELEGEL